MRKVASLNPDPKSARAAAWAGLWLACLAALLSWTAGVSPAHTAKSMARRHAAIFDMPLRMLAYFVACLITLRARAHAAPRTHRARFNDPRTTSGSSMRAHLRPLLRLMRNAHGAYDLTRIAALVRCPEPAIALMIRALRRGLTRRRPILPRKPRAQTPPTQTEAAAPAPTDTS